MTLKQIQTLIYRGEIKSCNYRCGYFHSFNHPIVNTVPYFHFVLDGTAHE
jgi:hypothetical protein